MPLNGTTRSAAERWTAIGVALLGAIVAGESLTHDIGWNEAGPGPGYFPFRVGLLLVGAAAVLWVQARRAGEAPFVTRDELLRTGSVFWPTAALAAAMFALGCYVPSAAYLAWMMRRHGGYSWGRSLASGIAVMVCFFVVFDR